MKQLNETNRIYSYPTKITKIGSDLVLTGKYFFVIISDEDVNRIIEDVVKQGKNLIIQNGSIIVYMKDNYVIIEMIDEGNFDRIFMVKPSALL